MRDLHDPEQGQAADACTHPACNTRAEHLETVTAALLPVLRHFLNGMLAPETLGWRLAYETAVGQWGEARGLAIAHRCQHFLSALLQSRPVPLLYHDPLDFAARNALSIDEADMLALIAAMQVGNTATARDLIEQLCGHGIPSMVVKTGLGLARSLDPASRPTPRKPMLRMI